MPLPIVILHGWGSKRQRWEKMISFLKHKGFQVYLPKLPGFFGPIGKPWNTANYADWVREFLKASGLTRVNLVGHSFGGQIAIYFTRHYPNQVKKLVLVSSAGVRPPVSLKRSLFWLLAKSGKLIFKLPGFKRFFSPAQKLIYRVANESDYVTASPLMKQTLAQVTREDQTRHLPHIYHGALILWGGKDKMTPLKDGEKMRQLMPHATLKVFPEATHDLPFAHPRKVASQIGRAHV